ncbi:DUF6062 family protein [Acetivibrio straminisolvens]|jgi:hypothetical protein|uniref:ABC transporter substrate-binding protein n=1 Tax=Acetivibrio straminisolvens JCM 21531 TaxID=1294263 RepID=W4V9F7_9FIRM|nr:DUF6062 family protein [Acetivibrio straminisolvens]GAE89428.1 hypothetical protein JCM21531_2953 [Acetivibrio straminisolvens JCM 21531]
MKEKIYTIPVTDAFNTDCECPMCVLEKKLEDENVEYVLGPFLMEPEGRMETNENGFCKRHFEFLYNTQANRLGLGLIVDTHMVEQNAKLKKNYEDKKNQLKKDADVSFIKNLSGKLSSKQTETRKFVDELIANLNKLENSCTICTRINKTMDRYIDVILYLYFKENDFKELFHSRKGFCLKHLKALLEGTGKYLGPKETAIFVDNLLSMQVENMERIQQEVNWFTKKFDYRNNDAPWGNSKDALPRSIQKLVGFCNLK